MIKVKQPVFEDGKPREETINQV